MFEKVIDMVQMERIHQDKKWGEKNKDNTPWQWLPILGEEIGEVNSAVRNRDWDNLEEELIDVAAVAIQWLEHIYRKKQSQQK